MWFPAPPGTLVVVSKNPSTRNEKDMTTPDFFDFETICAVFYGEGAVAVDDHDHYDPDFHVKAMKEDRLTD